MNRRPHPLASTGFAVSVRRMARPLSGEYRLGRRLITGVADPTGMNLDFLLDEGRVYVQGKAHRERCHGAKVVPPGLVQNVADDLAHATCASLQKRLGVTRESRLRFLKPLYAGSHFRADGITHGHSADLCTVQVRFMNDKGVVCVEGEVEIFLLKAEVVRRMTPDGMIPLELRRFFPRD